MRVNNVEGCVPTETEKELILICGHDVQTSKLSRFPITLLRHHRSSSCIWYDMTSEWSITRSRNNAVHAQCSYSSDKRANGLLETTSLSSPSRSSSPSLLGLSSFLLLPGGASRCDAQSASPSCSCWRKRLLSECLSCRTAISCVLGCCFHVSIDQKRKVKSLFNAFQRSKITSWLGAVHKFW